LESSPHAALRDYVAELEGGMGFHWLIMHWFENNPAAYATFKRSLDND
jgi:P2-related tail formation protein